MELKKSYAGLVWWIIIFTAVLFLFCFVRIEDEGLIIRLICAVMNLGVAGLAYMIYHTEYVYWYNGTTYEEAVAAGSQRRKAFAKKHLDRFAICAAVTLLYSSAAQGLGWPFWIDIVLSTVALIAAAISTMKFKL